MAESSRKKRTVTRKPRVKKSAKASIAAPRKKRVYTKRKIKGTSVTSAFAQGPSFSEIAAEESKYYSGPVMQKFIEEKGYELPLGYGDSRITLMVRDPYWVHAYWELPHWKIDELKSEMGHDIFSTSKKILRVYDVTDVNFTGMNAHRSFDVDLTEEARNWYLNTGETNRSYCIDIGYLTREGKFYVAARSNVVSTPRDGMSEVIDEEWLTIDWERMYALSGGFGIGKSSGEIREMLKKRLREEMSSGMFSGWSGSAVYQKQHEKDFWLVANAELIVYGATEPTAKVFIQGLPVKMRQDGTFSMRFALPDGRQEIPIVAIDKDDDQKRSITQAVEKRTK